MPIKLLRNLVAVKIIEEEVSSGGLFIPKTPETKKRGTVVAVGPGFYTAKGEFVETTVKVGDIIAFATKGEKIEIDNQVLHVMGEETVIGIIKE